MCGLKALTLHDNPKWDKSQPPDALESYAIKILVLDLSWLNCGPEQRVSALTFGDSSPRKAHNHKGPISVVKKGLTSSHWPNRERQSGSLLSADWSLDVQTGPFTPDEPIRSTAPGHPRCEIQLYTVHERQVFVMKFTPEGCHCGPPFCFQAFSIFRHLSLDLKGVYMCTC